jgi:hypothetical protein
MATHFADLNKSASGLLKDSFPFDGKTLQPRSHFTLKASVKAAAANTSVSSTFESTPSTTEAKVEATSECKPLNLTVKESFSTKDSTAVVTATVTDKLVAGSKLGVETKISRKTKDSKSETSVVVNPSFDYANDTLALRVKSELPLHNLASSWKAELAGTFRREKVQFGGSVKLQAGSPLLDGYAATLAYAAGESQFTLGAVGERADEGVAVSVVASYFQKFCSDCDGRVATEVKVPITLADPSIRAALLWNTNNDTTVGAYADNHLNLGTSLRVKLNPQVTVYGSAFAPLSSLAASSAAENRVFGFGVEFSS